MRLINASVAGTENYKSWFLQIIELSNRYTFIEDVKDLSIIDDEL